MNKPRLIDANVVLEILKLQQTEPDGISWAIREITDLPTAYDIDKVVEQLEALPNINQNYHSSTEMIDREDAIEIVKGGAE